MISILPYHGDNPFNDFPQLRTIWPTPFQQWAEEGYCESIDLKNDFYLKNPGAETISDMFLIMEEHRVIGITGFYFQDSIRECHLRWHGIIPSHRGQKHSELALKYMINYAVEQYPDIQTLVESYPISDYGTHICRYFKKYGFDNDGEPVFYPWSNMMWQNLSIDIQHLTQVLNNDTMSL